MKRVFACVLLAGSALAADPPLVPDQRLTPGQLDPAHVASACRLGTAKAERDVTESMKKAVFREYGVDPRSGKFEVDHLISIELGGANTLQNLWPQSYDTPDWNAHVKDHLEDHLCALVRAGTVTLEAAHRAIIGDWRSGYCRYVDPSYAPCAALGMSR